MKNLLLIPALFFIVLLFAKGDEKILKQVKTLIEKKEFQKAADALRKVSPEGQSSSNFLQLTSEVYDSLKDYKQSINAYQLLLKEGANKDAIMARVDFLRSEQAKYEEAERVRIEKMKNCMKCMGMGYIENTATCETCNGKRTVRKECQRCRGNNGRMICSPCQGSGSVYNEAAKSNVGCAKCGGEGSSLCSNFCNRGFTDADCNTCKGNGTVVKRITCDLH